MLLLLSGRRRAVDAATRPALDGSRGGSGRGARSSERGPAAWARALYAAQYSRLWLQASEAKDQRLLSNLAARGAATVCRPMRAS